MKVLVIRLSALGDVAMTVPVITSLADAYPDADITVLSRPFMRPLFAQAPDNVRFRGVEVDRYKGLCGLYKLYRELQKESRYDMVADLHDVLRSKVLRTFFRISGVKAAHIDKGRKEKRALTSIRHKQFRPLATSFARYEAVFAELGLPVKSRFRSIYGTGKGDVALFQTVTGRIDDGRHLIGIAPFAAHRGKILPANTLARLINDAAAHADWRIFLFGGGKAEAEMLERLSEGRPNVMSVAGKLKFEGELALMSHLEAMVSMDSANMHLASLTGTPVVSVWGATHPYAGFMGWGQSAAHAVQTVGLPCRPCSIYGNNPCERGDYACLTSITSRSIIQKIESIINHRG